MQVLSKLRILFSGEHCTFDRVSSCQIDLLPLQLLITVFRQVPQMCVKCAII